MYFRQIYSITFFCVYFFSLEIIQGQEYYSSNPADNILYINPSYSSINSTSLLNFNYRNQYPFSSYTNYNLAYLQNVESLNSNFGAFLTHQTQNQGVFNYSTFAFNYAYKFNITKKSYLSAGLRGGYNLSKVDYGDLTFENGNGSVNEMQSLNHPDFSIGATAILNERTFIGFSVNHLLTPYINNAEKLERQYSLSYSGRIGLFNPYGSDYLEPIAVLVSQNSRNSIYYGANLIISNIIGGILLHQDFSFKFSYAAILLGISFENYKIVYTYDLNLSGKLIFSQKMAAHEVTFLIKWQYKDKRKKRGAIKCPKF